MTEELIQHILEVHDLTKEMVPLKRWKALSKSALRSESRGHCVPHPTALDLADNYFGRFCFENAA